MSFTRFSHDEIMEIASSLEDYHACFYKFFEMSTVGYSTEIPTAAVRFHKDQNPDLLVNEEFWKKQNHRERLFVICHECLHVLLCHDKRSGKDIPGATPELVNIAQDITINELIVNLFKFNRDDLREWKKYCWIDTCFDDPTKILKNETFTYYLKLLITNKKKDMPQLLDEHESDGDDSSTQPDSSSPVSVKSRVESVISEIASELSQDELESLINSLPEGQEAGGLEGALSVMVGSRRAIKVNFKKLVQHLKRTRIKLTEVDTESFVQENKRYNDITRRENITLPGTHQLENISKDRLLTALFMDISGSCINYLPVFNKVFGIFDAEKSIFEIRTFTFDLSVKEVSPGQRIIGGGGTRFHIIENKVQELKVEYGKYPDCVIIITDGEGNCVTPELPKRWVWLLTPDPSSLWLPKESKRYLISDITI